MPIRLLALDLDGTIIDARMQASPRVRWALRRAREAGVHVTLATGRFFDSTRVFANELGIHGPLICFQGALVQDSGTEEVHLRRGVPLGLAHELINFVHDRGWDACVYIDDRLYVEKATPNLRFYAEYSPIKEQMNAVGDLGAFLSCDPLKIVVVVEAEQALSVSSMLRERFEGRLQIVRSFHRFVEATNLTASKGQALSFLAQMRGVTQMETMAIGDNDNDADMIAWAGLGIAMGNASDAVKAAASHVVPSIEEDGAALAIERFILEQYDG
ncbi:MAG TPA: Cof-type HAD-IIB family hydrolase [Anaerolineae bacterium]|nr:Cof-type HAD-IIB family hydrolase [Anaerolineae bacterium]